MAIWICSDWHLNHDKPFIWEKRGFSTVEEMNREIIRRHNALVAANDEVYVLGDLCLGGGSPQALEAGCSMICSMNGKLHVVAGNHDTDARLAMYTSCRNVVEVAQAMRLRYNGFYFYLSHYPTLCGTLSNGKPLRQNTINLCGHTHTQDRWSDWDKGIIYHCDMDAHDCAPSLLDTVIDELKNKLEN